MQTAKTGMAQGIIFPGLTLLLLISYGLRAQARPDAGAVADTLEAEQVEAVEEFDVTVGYNLKVTVRLAPVYQESSLVSPIVTHLPRNSVVKVLKEEDRWYKIEFGPEDNRQAGWVISYGMERTHEVEFLVRTREDATRYEGKKVVVVSGEAAVRSFPASQGGLLRTVYRDEVFDITGESADYYRIVLSKAVQGWIWKGDVDDYIEPKYTREQVKEMSSTSRQQVSRLESLYQYLADLEQRRVLLNQEIEKLEALWAEKVAAEQALTQRALEPSVFDYSTLKKRFHLGFGIQRQAYAGSVGLGPAMLKGFGLSFDWKDNQRIDFTYHSGKPAVRKIGPEQEALPSSMDNLDTLAVSASLMRIGLRRGIPAPNFPLLRGMKHYLYCGLAKMSLKPSAGGYSAKQTLWGPVFAWGMNRPLFKRIQLDIALNFFLTRTDVTDVRNSGRQLLQSKKAFLLNSGFSAGVIWDL